jgi:hypothetical protein
MVQTVENEIRSQNILNDRESIVNVLRIWSKQSEIKNESVIIPDECEKFGFVQGDFNIGVMLHFLADMLEE